MVAAILCRGCGERDAGIISINTLNWSGLRAEFTIYCERSNRGASIAAEILDKFRCGSARESHAGSDRLESPSLEMA